jgi:clathrin heavy chain
MGIFTELGIMYAKFKVEALMEHIKLYATRVNIPRLIRTCDEQQHWKELAFLYCQYDEYDNAAMVMINHSPDAWDHSSFKDVLVKVANMELYYRAIGFYLDEQPHLLNELLSVLSARVDHSRVVDLLRRNGQLPLARPYLESAQQANLPAVNEAVNQLCVDEEDYEALRASIETYDNFDAVALAASIERHELMEFRRVAATLYKQNKRYRKSLELSKADKLYKDAMETAAMSGDTELVQELLTFFVDGSMKECFAACLYTCYDLIKVDVALELAWLNGMLEYVMPFLIQAIRHYTGLVDKLERLRLDTADEEASKKAAEAAEEQQSNMYAQLMPPALPAPEMPPQGGFGGAPHQF